MNTTKTFSWEDLIASIRSLPNQSQQQLADEITQRVDDFNTSRLTDKQREIIEERMNMPREHVSREKIHSLLRKYNPAL